MYNIARLLILLFTVAHYGQCRGEDEANAPVDACFEPGVQSCVEEALGCPGGNRVNNTCPEGSFCCRVLSRFARSTCVANSRCNDKSGTCSQATSCNADQYEVSNGCDTAGCICCATRTCEPNFKCRDANGICAASEAICTAAGGTVLDSTDYVCKPKNQGCVCCAGPRTCPA